MTLDQKIELFIIRLEELKFRPAREMIERGTDDWDFAILSVIASYFEMIAKYREGFDMPGKSEEHFKKGIEMVFQNWRRQSGCNPDEQLDWLYEKVRCGLYHLGMAERDIVMSRDISTAILFVCESSGKLVSMHINIVKLLDTIENDFDAYKKQLRNPANGALRSNFEKRWAFDDR